MILIFGGAYQGKLEYALKRFGLSEDNVYRCVYTDTTAPGGKLIYELDKWILALVKAEANAAGTDTADAIRRFIAANADAIVICNDVTCGVVPEDPILRRWREAAGRAMAELARVSDEVVRVFCGIATILKSNAGS